MTEFTIKKGLDLPLAGRASGEVQELPLPSHVAVYPTEFPAVKARMEVEEGAKVKRGDMLFSCKRRPELKFCSPAAGTVKEITLGERRSIREILLETDPANEAVAFTSYTQGDIEQISREEALETLQNTGMLAYLVQRPFSRIAQPSLKPKSIFVNGMSTAPFEADPEVVLDGKEKEFQAGLDILKHLTDGPVYLSIAANASSPALTEAEGVRINRFKGPHPAGNTSVHISRLDPIKPNDCVWTVDARHLVSIGQTFLEGELPATRMISLSGPGVKDDSQCHYRIHRGARVSDLLANALNEGENRIILGDVLMGDRIGPEHGMGFYKSGITVLPEERKREFLGWMAPGLKTFSTSRLFLSSWLKTKESWPLTTADHGSRRAMFASGVYDKVMPLNIMTDFLLRAIIAHDTDEAVKLGILETDPEDFALCSYICPSRTDVIGIVEQGLNEIEEEGIYSQE